MKNKFEKIKKQLLKINVKMKNTQKTKKEKSNKNTKNITERNKNVYK